ncbi:hypothetical protein M758_UG216600 [Ceratodon purpureus]|nr:hypothetical protein M758_UG216600 [Ceratodon purpureus]
MDTLRPIQDLSLVQILMVSIWAFLLFLHQGCKRLLTFLEQRIVGTEMEVEGSVVPLTKAMTRDERPPLRLDVESLVISQRVAPEGRRKYYAVRRGYRPGIYCS